MQFRIADTFTDSLARLTGDEQRAVKTAAFDLQMNPAHPGLKLHQVDRAKDKDFWSVRVTRDIRLIVHRTASSFLLCYVDHHDAAYQWAERRRLERHPTTGAAQLVEIRETVREIRVPRYVDVDVPASILGAAAGEPATLRTAIFADASADDLLGYGVPVEWLDDVRAATEDTLLDLADHLPGEAAEALLQLATGSAPDRPAPALAGADPFAHPDAQRRFRVMADVEALERALDYPWEKWTVFLHPAQRQLVEREYRGPARVAGSAGTGKTIVALHRAVHLARAHSESRVLLATFSDALAAALRVRLKRLIGNEPMIAERLEVHSMSGIGRRLYAANVGRLELATDEDIRELLRQAAADVEGHRFGAHFLWTEWSTVVDAWQLASWEDYRDVQRLGRKTRLAEKQRELLWSIFSWVRSALGEQGKLTEPGMFARVAAKMAEAPHPPFDFCVIDEAQDIGVAELRFLAAVGGGRPNSLFLGGDLGQRLRYRAAPALRRLHPRARPVASDGRRPWLGVPRRPAGRVATVPHVHPGSGWKIWLIDEYGPPARSVAAAPTASPAGSLCVGRRHGCSARRGSRRRVGRRLVRGSSDSAGSESSGPATARRPSISPTRICSAR